MLVSCMHRMIVEGSGVGIVLDVCIMHVDVHRVMFWMAATSEQGCLVCMADTICL